MCMNFVLLSIADSQSFSVFLQPLLALPAGQTIECRFFCRFHIDPLFETGCPIHICIQSVVPLHKQVELESLTAKSLH